MDVNIPTVAEPGADRIAISGQIWDSKYRLKTPDGTPVDLTIVDTWRRVATALAGVEQDLTRWEQPFYEALQDFRFLPAGRILSGAGTDRRVTRFNCFVMGDIADDLGTIFDHLREAALPMQQGGYRAERHTQRVAHQRGADRHHLPRRRQRLQRDRAVFPLAYTRKVLQPDGTKIEEEVSDYALRHFRALFGDDTPLPQHFVTAQDLSPAEHVRMQAAVQRHVDSAISKTVNVPEGIPFEAFHKVYLDAYRSGCKGCTTYRPNAITGSVLEAKPAPTPPVVNSVNGPDLMISRFLDVSSVHLAPETWTWLTAPWRRTRWSPRGTHRVAPSTPAHRL